MNCKGVSMERTLEIVKIYLEHNTLTPKEVPGLIELIHNKIKELDVGQQKLVMPIPVEETITDDYIICLEDMKKVTLLRRHLNQHFKMTMDEYREKWGLPDDYPAVPKNYANKRRRIAKKQGLGKKAA
jgi:predicted transcriptional regulator